MTSGLSVGDKWPKIVSYVGGLGGRGAWPRDPPLICPYSSIGLTQTMLTIIKSFTVYNQSYYSLLTQKRKLSEYAACENGDVENVKFML